MHPFPTPTDVTPHRPPQLPSRPGCPYLKLLLGCALAGVHGFAQTVATDQPTLSAQLTQGRIELRWRTPRSVPTSGWPTYEVQQSRDLSSWTPILAPVRASGPDQTLTQPLATDGGVAFYRLLVRPPAVAKSSPAQGGSAVFGFGQFFDEHLAAIGQVTPTQFATLHPQPPHLDRIAWDPAFASFYAELNTAPEDKDQDRDDGGEWLPRYDFRLNDAEKAVLRKNGFVVSERLGTSTFAEAFYRVWNDDLPVFVSTDAMLQAWHRSYDAMLEELEETTLFYLMEQMLEGMYVQLGPTATVLRDGPLKDSLLDADLLITVAKSLLEGGTNAVPSPLKQQDRVAATLAAIRAENLVECFDLFGHPRTVDFSQFKVRGHYENSERLSRYFKTVMWLGRTDLRVAGPPFEDCRGLRHAPYERELGTALVLNHLLRAASQFDNWLQAEHVVQAFVGWTDSMNFGQLGDLLAAAGLSALSDLPQLNSLDALRQLQDRINAGTYGVQHIKSDYFVAPLGPERLALPRSFTVFGQRFVLDSWVTAQVVYDDILWTENGVTNEVVRRVPSALDVAFAALGNDHVVPNLVARIQRPDARASADHSIRFRDGLPYQHNLEAARRVIDAQSTAAWRETLYTGWLDTLRQLSPPTTDSRYPEAMRTRAWAMKTLNTQLASWTELRHDTILYAKQSYTPPGQCSYPDGFVEPRPEFFARLEQLARDAADRIAQLPVPQWASATIQTRAEFGSQEKQVNLSSVRERQVQFLEYFAGNIHRLRALVDKELRHERLDAEDIRFLDRLIQSTRFNGAGGPRRYDGWYTRMFYQSALVPDPEFYLSDGAQKYDALVADVHTDLPSPDHGDPGGVLHEATGIAHLLILAVDHGDEKMIYAGPVFSHFEFEIVGPPKRLSDKQWQAKLGQAGIGEPVWIDPAQELEVPWTLPDHPEWTRDYLVPGRPNPNP